MGTRLLWGKRALHMAFWALLAYLLEQGAEAAGRGRRSHTIQLHTVTYLMGTLAQGAEAAGRGRRACKFVGGKSPRTWPRCPPPFLAVFRAGESHDSVTHGYMSHGYLAGMRRGVTRFSSHTIQLHTVTCLMGTLRVCAGASHDSAVTRFSYTRLHVSWVPCGYAQVIGLPAMVLALRHPKRALNQGIPKEP
jgi:hypothetical protein